MASFKEEFHTTLKLSSMKGVPMIVNSPNLVQRSLWTLAVLFFFGCCVYHVSTNVLAYLQFPKVVTVNQLGMDFLNPNDTVPFPTVSVCNVNPFTSNASVYKKYGIPLPKDFHKKVLEITSCMNCTIGEHITMETLRATLLTLRGYYQYVGKENMRRIGHENMVVQCIALVYSSSSHVAIPCEKLTKSYTYIHLDHGLCYAYNAVSNKKNLVIGYNFILHLDSSFDNINTEFDPMSLFNQNAGAKLYTFDPQFLPSTVGTFALVSPGKANMNQLSITRVDRLSTPYSERECVDTDQAINVTLENERFNLNYLSCFGACTYKYVIDRCNCTDIFMLQNPETEPPKYGYCGNLNQSKEELFKKMDCSESVKGAGAVHCTKKCNEPCKEIKYTLFSSTTRWPLPSQTGTFYTNFIKNKTFEKQYSDKEHIYKKIANGDKSVSELERFFALRIIEDNFASVYVYVDSLYYTHLKDEAKLSIAALFSQLGGSLNIWSGITVLIFVEIIDLIIRLKRGSKRETSILSMHGANGIDIDSHGNQVHNFSHSPSPSPSNSVEL